MTKETRKAAQAAKELIGQAIDKVRAAKRELEARKEDIPQEEYTSNMDFLCARIGELFEALEPFMNALDYGCAYNQAKGGYIKV